MLPLLYEEPGLVIVDKPSGLAVHRGWDAAETNALTTLRDQLGRWVQPVHRLDRGTSGCLVFALDEESTRELSAVFVEGTVDKTYLALARGRLASEGGTIDYAIPRSEDGPRVDAVTDWCLVARLEGASLVIAWPRTGRLHQIRRHFRHLGHPLLGDTTWGDNKANKRLRQSASLHRLALHALRLALSFRGHRIEVASPVPADLAEPLGALGLPRDVLEASLARAIAARPA